MLLQEEEVEEVDIANNVDCMHRYLYLWIWSMYPPEPKLQLLVIFSPYFDNVSLFFLQNLQLIDFVCIGQHFSPIIVIINWVLVLFTDSHI